MPAAPLPVAAPLSLSVRPQSLPPAGPQYRITDLTSFRADPDSFYEFSYRATFRAMVEAVLECEAPLGEDILAQRISRAHGWLRTGGRIRERIALHLKDVERTHETSGDFVWRKGTVAPVIDYRQTQDGEARRSILEIPTAELASVAIASPNLFDEPDPALAMARLLGVERLRPRRASGLRRRSNGAGRIGRDRLSIDRHGSIASAARPLSGIATNSAIGINPSFSRLEGKTMRGHQGCSCSAKGRNILK